MQAYYVYILKCKYLESYSFYTGWTTNPMRRFIQHLAGKGAKYTRSFRPVECVALYKVATKSDALRLEARIKQLSAKAKSLLAKGNQVLVNRLCCYAVFGSNIMLMQRKRALDYTDGLIDALQLRALFIAYKENRNENR